MSLQTQDPRRRALWLAKEAGRYADLDVAGARILRVRSSIHVELPRAGVLARVEAADGLESAENQVRIASLLADRGAPAVRLVKPELQPMISSEGAVTLWEWLEASSVATAEAIGRAARHLHDSTRDTLPAELPSLDPLRRALRDLEASSFWPDSEALAGLHRQTEELASVWPELVRDDPLGTVIVHGDLHADNAMATERGLVLIDLEETAVGPASWDFVPLAVGVNRYGVPPDDYRGFIEGYGGRPPAGPEHDRRCRAYELMVTAWAIRLSKHSSRMADEASRRVSSLVGRSQQPWRQV